jgi:hypothetical protein
MVGLGAHAYGQYRNGVAPNDAVAKYPEYSRELIVFAAGWYCSGYPRVTIGHRHAAALMATKAGPQTLNDIRLPWESFVVDVPDKLVHSDNGWLQHLTISSVGPGIVIATIGQSGGSGILVTSIDSLNRVSETNRSLELACRLLFGVVLELNTHRAAQLHARGVKAIRRDHSGRALPTTFTLGRPIKIDCRDAVRDYSLGKRGNALTVQSLIRGHWKMQAHGPELSLRKPIFIEPYWRGPEDGPGVIRSHEVGR